MTSLRTLSLACVLVSGFAVSSFAASAQKPTSAAPAPPATPAAAPAAAQPATLTDGTAIKLRLTETLTSATAKVGQSVAFEVVDEVQVDGVPVVAKGAQALATVTIAETKKFAGRGGKGAMTAGMVGTALVFFPAAPFLLFVHGKDITIPKGTEVTAFVSGDVHLVLARFAPSALSVTPSKHVIAVKKKGYTPWARTMTVTGNGSKLNADLEAAL